MDNRRGEQSHYCITESWCTTNLKSVNVHYTWRINQFSIYSNMNNGVIDSPNFTAVNDDRFLCYLRVCTKMIHLNSSGYISLYIFVEPLDRGNVSGWFRFSILNSRNEKINTIKSGRMCTFFPQEAWGIKNFIRHDRLFNLVDTMAVDKLVINCQVCLVMDIYNTVGEDQHSKFKLPTIKLSKDFGNLLDDDTYSDVTITVDKCVFRAHKAILTARSDVFAAMFRCDMQERASGHVNIKDMNPRVFEQMLQFIYTGQAPYVNKMPFQLLRAADMYAMDDLKALCEKSILYGIRIGTAAEILILADMYNARNLKISAAKFFYHHASDIIKTDGWKTLLANHIHIIVHIHKTLGIPPLKIDQFVSTPSVNIEEVQENEPEPVLSRVRRIQHQPSSPPVNAFNWIKPFLWVAFVFIAALMMYIGFIHSRDVLKY